VYFPVAEVELNPFVPVLLGAVVSLILGQVGLTGGIATLPFMMSVLGFTSPSASSTNLIFVLMSPLGSVYSYWQEHRLLWRLALPAAAGGLIGSFIGPRIRVGPLSDIMIFKALFGILLGLVGLSLFFRRHPHIEVGSLECYSGFSADQKFTFSGTTYGFSHPQVFFAGLVAGGVSTTFGLGTGFLLVPFYTAVLKLPIYVVASAALLSTLIISFSGAIVYSTMHAGVSTAPDLRLGFLLGVGGIMGGFLSAKVQGRMSTRALHKILGATLFLWALAYLKQGI